MGGMRSKVELFRVIRIYIGVRIIKRKGKMGGRRKIFSFPVWVGVKGKSKKGQINKKIQSIKKIHIFMRPKC